MFGDTAPRIYMSHQNIMSVTEACQLVGSAKAFNSCRANDIVSINKGNLMPIRFMNKELAQQQHISSQGILRLLNYLPILAPFKFSYLIEVSKSTSFT